jgi:GT2 family glycosyltransferase
LREPIVAGAVVSPSSNYVRLCHNIAEFHRFMPGRKSGPTQFIAGASMGFRRSVIEELGGFKNCAMLAPDMEMVLRAQSKGYSIFFEPDATVTHNPDRSTLASVFSYSSKHASETILYRNQYRSLLRTPLVIRIPALTVLASPLIALKVTLGIYLKNTSLMRFFWTIPLVYSLKVAWCWGAALSLQRHKKNGNKSGMKEYKGGRQSSLHLRRIHENPRRSKSCKKL